MAARYCEKCDEAWPADWKVCPVHGERTELHRKADATLTQNEARSRANHAAFERHYRESRGIPSTSDVPPLTEAERELADRIGTL